MNGSLSVLVNFVWPEGHRASWVPLGAAQVPIYVQHSGCSILSNCLVNTENYQEFATLFLLDPD